MKITSFLPTLVVLSHCLVLRTEVKLTPPEMINRNAKRNLVIKNDHHLDHGHITLEEDQEPADEAKPKAAEPTPVTKLNL